MKTLLTTILLLVVLLAQSQNYTIIGKINDSITGNNLKGVYIQTVENGNSIGTSTNDTGFYSLQLPKGVYEIKFSTGHYTVVTEHINVNENKRLDKSLIQDIMFRYGKIYVVVLVVLVILSGLFIYLINLDRKISRLEKE